MNEKLRIELCSDTGLGKEPFYAELELPATAEQIRDAKQRARIVSADDAGSVSINIIEFDPIPELEEVRLDATTVEELNFLAMRMDALCEEQFLVYRALFDKRFEDMGSDGLLRRFFDHERFNDRYLTEELLLTEIMLPPLEGAELKELRKRITEDHDVRRAAMFLKLLRNSYSSSGKSFASQPFDIRKLFGLIQELESRMANVVVENQDFETLIRHYDRPDAFFYLDPPYYSTEDMYEAGFGNEDHIRLRDILGNIKGRFLLSYNDCPEIRGLYEGFSLFDFSRIHSMAQRYEAGKEFKELLIANYDLYERERTQPKQLTVFDCFGEDSYDYEKILKESIISCRIK